MQLDGAADPVLIQHRVSVPASAGNTGGGADRGGGVPVGRYTTPLPVTALGQPAIAKKTSIPKTSLHRYLADPVPG